MIETKRGDTTIKGTAEELCADFSCITGALNKTFTEALGKETAEKLLGEAYKDGFKTDDELNAEIADEIEKLKKKYADASERIEAVKKLLEEMLNG